MVAWEGELILAWEHLSLTRARPTIVRTSVCLECPCVESGHIIFNASGTQLLTSLQIGSRMTSTSVGKVYKNLWAYQTWLSTCTSCRFEEASGLQLLNWLQPFMWRTCLPMSTSQVWPMRLAMARRHTWLGSIGATTLFTACTGCLNMLSMWPPLKEEAWEMRHGRGKRPLRMCNLWLLSLACVCLTFTWCLMNVLSLLGSPCRLAGDAAAYSPMPTRLMTLPTGAYTTQAFVGPSELTAWSERVPTHVVNLQVMVHVSMKHQVSQITLAIQKPCPMWSAREQLAKYLLILPGNMILTSYYDKDTALQDEDEIPLHICAFDPTYFQVGPNISLNVFLQRDGVQFHINASMLPTHQGLKDQLSSIMHVPADSFDLRHEHGMPWMFPTSVLDSKDVYIMQLRGGMNNEDTGQRSAASLMRASKSRSRTPQRGVENEATENMNEDISPTMPFVENETPPRWHRSPPHELPEDEWDVPSLQSGPTRACSPSFQPRQPSLKCACCGRFSSLPSSCTMS